MQNETDPTKQQKPTETSFRLTPIDMLIAALISTDIAISFSESASAGIRSMGVWLIVWGLAGLLRVALASARAPEPPAAK